MFEKYISAFYALSGVDRVGLLIGFLLVENNISMLPNVGPLYYGFMLLALLYLLKKEQLAIGSLSMVGLYFVCIVSIWINDVPEFFQPYQRFMTFLLITLLVSPVLYNNAFVRFRSQVFVTIIKLLQWVILTSVIYAMMGGGYFRNRYFQGVTNHSMLLGPFAALCTLFCIFRLIIYAQDKRKKIYYGLLILCSLFCLLQAASRTAFLGTLVSCVVFLAVYYRNNIGRYLKVVITVCVVLLLSFPLWERYMDKLEMKNSGKTELNTQSRDVHWKQRWKEFRSSPAWGIGFSAVATDGHKGSTFTDEGKVETGSSWLCMLSMTGLFGFFSLLFVFVIALKRVWCIWNETPLLSGFLISLLCFWALHMMAEGYIFAGGNSLAFCVWLTLGMIYGVTKDIRLAYELQQKLAE